MLRTLADSCCLYCRILYQTHIIYFHADHCTSDHCRSLHHCTSRLRMCCMSQLRSLLTLISPHSITTFIFWYDVTNCNDDHTSYLKTCLSYNMGDKWRMIGRCLEIEEAKMNTIDTNLSTNESSEKAFQMLLSWATSDNTTSLNSLLDALKTCNFSIYINCSATVSSVVH